MCVNSDAMHIDALESAGSSDKHANKAAANREEEVVADNDEENEEKIALPSGLTHYYMK